MPYVKIPQIIAEHNLGNPKSSKLCSYIGGQLRERGYVPKTIRIDGKATRVWTKGELTMINQEVIGAVLDAL